MKKEDKEFDGVLKKDKSYLYLQRQLLPQIYYEHAKQKKSTSQDNKMSKTNQTKSILDMSSSFIQQQFVKNIQDQHISPKSTQNRNNLASKSLHQGVSSNDYRDTLNTTLNKSQRNMTINQLDNNGKLKMIKIEINEGDETNITTNIQETQIKSEKVPEQAIKQTARCSQDQLSRNNSQVLLKNSNTNSNGYNIFSSTSVAKFKSKKNSMSNTIFFTPFQSRAQTPTNHTQICNKNDTSIETNENSKVQCFVQKLNNLGIVADQQKFQIQPQNTKMKVSQNETHRAKQQQNNSLLNRISQCNKMATSTLQDKNIQLESSILSQNKAQMMEQLKVKNNNSFYGKFIQHALSQENNTQKDQTKPVFSNRNTCLSPNIKKNQTQYLPKQSISSTTSPRVVAMTPYDTNIDQIKSKLSVQLLELIKNDFYGTENDQILQDEENTKDKEEQTPENQQDIKFRKIQFPSEEYYHQKFDKINRNIVNNRESNQQLSARLFSILQSKDQIVIHTSQNKDLMHISDRKDIISLVQWYEDMLNQIYNDTVCPSSPKSPQSSANSSYSKIFSDLQAIHQACLSEIIRQVSISSVERGQLLKKVMENLISLLKDGFSRQNDEKIAFQKDIYQEIQQIQKDCADKIDYYIPLISNITDQLEKKDAMSKRVVLEFKYLKKKNHKLEKFLNEGRKEYKNLQEDYKILSRQLDDIKQFHTQLVKSNGKIADKFTKQLEDISQQSQLKQKLQLDKMKQENDKLKQMQTKYENDSKQISIENKIKQSELDELEEVAQKQEFNNDAILTQQPLGMRSNFQQRSDNNMISDRQIIEIEGLDGLRFVLASVACQVDNDLIQRKDAETDTKSYFTTNEIEAQTEDEVKDTLTQECQTPIEWINIVSQSEKPNSMTLKETTIQAKQISQLSLEQNSLLDSPVQKYISAPESNNKFNYFIESLSFDVNNDDRKDNQLDELIQKSDQYETIKFTETLENTLRASIEDDISDLHLLLSSKQRFVTDVFQKIVDYNLLKENQFLKYEQLNLFINDSKAFKQEENLRLKNIWNKCKLQLIEYVKSKISLAEKQVEIDEAHKNLNIENGLYQKLIYEYENVLEQINSNTLQINATKKDQNNQDQSVLNESINSIIFDQTNIDEDTQTNPIQKLSDDVCYSTQQSTFSIKSGRYRQSVQIQKSPVLNMQHRQSVQLTQSQYVGRALDDRNKPKSPLKANKSGLSKLRRQSSSISIQRSNKRTSTITQKSPLPQERRRDLQENTPGKQLDDSLNSIDKGQERSSFKGNQKFAKLVNIIINHKNSIITKRQIEEQSETGSMETQRMLTSYKHSAIDILKNVRFKKQQLRKKVGIQTSLNQDAAFNFVQTFGNKMMNTRTKKNKGPVFTEQNTRKYINLIYNDKIKQIKSQDKTNPLHNVAYDFFLNKFGFKKLAEKNLQQFLRSLQSHSHIESVKVFMRFFGIDHETNYDIDDFNFYVNCMIQLSESIPPIYSQLNIYSLPKVIELLFKTFENKINSKFLNKIKQELESMKSISNEASLKNKNVIDQELAIQQILQAKIEEKRINYITLRPIYLAGDVNNDEVIGYDEFMMLMRHIEKEKNSLNIMELFYFNIDMVDEITGSKKMSYSQFSQMSFENKLFTLDKQQAYIQYVDIWDQIKNIQLLKEHWQQKKDILRLRFIKAQQYKNFYRLMISKIDDYFQSQNNNQMEENKEQSTTSISKIPCTPKKINSVYSFENLDEQPNQASQFKQKKTSQFYPSNQVILNMNLEESEKQKIIWIIYKLLDDESKRVILDTQIEKFIPNEFIDFTYKIEELASENNCFILQ